jgi:hypothetical protein
MSPKLWSRARRDSRAQGVLLNPACETRSLDKSTRECNHQVLLWSSNTTFCDRRQRMVHFSTSPDCHMAPPGEETVGRNIIACARCCFAWQAATTLSDYRDRKVRHGFSTARARTLQGLRHRCNPEVNIAAEFARGDLVRAGLVMRSTA